MSSKKSKKIKQKLDRLWVFRVDALRNRVLPPDKKMKIWPMRLVLQKYMLLPEHGRRPSAHGCRPPARRCFYMLYGKYNVNVNCLINGDGDMFRTDPPIKKNDDGMAAPMDEMLFMVNNPDMVRFAMLSCYIGNKTQYKTMINELLSLGSH